HTHHNSNKTINNRNDSGTSVPDRYSALLPLVRNLKLRMCLTDPANRKTALRVLWQAVARGDWRLEAPFPSVVWGTHLSFMLVRTCSKPCFALLCKVFTSTITLWCVASTRSAFLGVFQASLSQDVFKDLMLPERPALKKLELHCERSLKYTVPRVRRERERGSYLQDALSAATEKTVSTK
uniref:Uncharacterized protein n=1 Tax=Sinocyclocheilus grahami TaxID=75366 RepID=A0A672MQJ2_SINGR